VCVVEERHCSLSPFLDLVDRLLCYVWLAKEAWTQTVCVVEERHCSLSPFLDLVDRLLCYVWLAG